jgi:hypothetical protein
MKRFITAAFLLALFASPAAAAVAPSAAHVGTLNGVNEGDSEILVNTAVPGLMGPEEKAVPFKIDGNTTVTVCYRKVDFCERAVPGDEGLKRMGEFERAYVNAGVSGANDVIVVGDPSNAARTVHVQVEY